MLDGSARITLPFGDEEREFRLAIGELRKVEAKTGAGAPELLSRLMPPVEAMAKGLSSRQLLLAGMAGSFRVDDVREPILQGLIGGGLAPHEAGRLVRDVVDERPLYENVGTAYAVLAAAIMGVADEPPGEREGASANPLSQTDAPASANSTATGSPSA